MNDEMLQMELNQKEDNSDQIVREVLRHPGLLAGVIAGLSSRSTVRFRCAKILRSISAVNPELLYPQFDLLASLLESADTIIKWNAIDIIANLTRVDRDDKFDGIVDRYYGLLYEGSLITAAHVVENSGKIVRAKPALRQRITDSVMQIDEVPLPTAECRNILAGKAFTTFIQYPELRANREDAITFARSKLNSTRPATRKKAEALLEQLSRALPESQLIAPCGMNCGICHAYLRSQNKCFGCRGENVKDSASIAHCVIRNCETVKASRSRLCFECDKYPCRRLSQLDKRYRMQYGMSMIENLESIKENGLDGFIETERIRWRCTDCGGVICVHKGYCLDCGPAGTNSGQV